VIIRTSIRPWTGVAWFEGYKEGYEMANMNVQDRAQYERHDLSSPDRTLRVSDRRPVLAFVALAVVLLAALIYAVAWGIDGWAQGLVLGVIVLTTIGLMIAVSPNRRA
jgi:fatty acid desaturase